MEASITVRLKGDPVTKLVELLGSPKKMLQVIGLRLQSFVDESFRTQGRGRWKPLAAMTVSLRGSGAPLQRTSAYRQSFVTTSDDVTFVRIGSDNPLARFHEYGTGQNPPGGRGWYVIVPRTAKVLVASGPTGFSLVLGKFVRHPGVPARPVLPTQEQADKLGDETVTGMLEEVIKQGEQGGTRGSH